MLKCRTVKKQKYRKEVQKYRSTEVQKYRNTKIQKDKVENQK